MRDGGESSVMVPSDVGWRGMLHDGAEWCRMVENGSGRCGMVFAGAI